MTEVEIRALVIASITEGTKVVEEVQIGTRRSHCRVDLAGFDGTYLHGYEIKSDADNLKRLPAQLEAYAKVFDTVTVVCGRKHLAKVRQQVPDWVFVMVAEEGQVLPARYGTYNPDRDLYATASLLWCVELRPLLRRHGLSQVGGKKSLVRRLVDGLPAHQLVADVSTLLRDRPQWARLTEPEKARRRRLSAASKRRKKLREQVRALRGGSI